jgi:hypothetical protein
VSGGFLKKRYYFSLLLSQNILVALRVKKIKKRKKSSKVTFVKSTIIYKQGRIWIKPIHKIFKFFILVLGVLIKTHIKFEIIFYSNQGRD